MRTFRILTIVCCLLGSRSSACAGEEPTVPKEFVSQSEAAKKQFDLGDYTGAEIAYRKLLEAVPDNVCFLSNLGVTLFRENKLKEAEAVLRKATELMPEGATQEASENSHALRELGITQFSLGKYDLAVETLLKAIALDPQDAVAHNHLGITYSNKGWDDLAVKELEKAIEVDEKYADANFNLAVVWATKTGANNENARKYYQRAVELGAERDAPMEKLIQLAPASGPGK